jgi:hypothetical protein
MLVESRVGRGRYRVFTVSSVPGPVEAERWQTGHVNLPAPHVAEFPAKLIETKTWEVSTCPSRKIYDLTTSLIEAA